MAMAVTISIRDKRDLCAYINLAFYWLSLSCSKRFYRAVQRVVKFVKKKIYKDDGKKLKRGKKGHIFIVPRIQLAVKVRKKKLPRGIALI